MKTWIKIYRGLLDWEWFQKPEMVQFYIYAIMKANYEDRSWQGVLIPRGSFVTSINSMRGDLGLTEQTIRTCIKRLVSTGEITSKSTNRFTIITICNYDNYQVCENDDNEQNNKQTTNEQQTDNKQITNEQQTNNNQITTTKELKKERNNINSCLYRQECETAVSHSVVKADFEKKVDFEKITAIYHEHCPSYPKIALLSSRRKQKVAIRFIDEMKGDYDLLSRIFKKMESSKFLRGDNSRGWKASFDWLFSNDTNWVKVAEGNYDNRPAAANPSVPASQRASISNAVKSCNDEWK